MFYKATPESPRMFENDLIDGFSRIPAWTVAALYVPATAVFLGISVSQGVSPWWVPVQFLLGWVAWSLLEYWLHRTLFHWIPKASWGEAFHFYLHGVHHKWHQDKLRLVMPPAVSLSLAVFFFGLTWMVGAVASPWVSPTWIWAFFAGLVFGYMFYDLMHYYLHHFKPHGRMMKALRHHHMAHHHNARFQEKKFGVSFTFWDHVFGTYE